VHRSVHAVDCTIRRVECLDIVETLGDCSHLDHTIAVVGIESLDLGASGSWLAMPVQSSMRIKYLFWNQTWTWRELSPGISLDNRSRCAASG
jgi:hypothetical protein